MRAAYFYRNDVIVRRASRFHKLGAAAKKRFRVGSAVLVDGRRRQKNVTLSFNASEKAKPIRRRTNRNSAASSDVTMEFTTTDIFVVVDGVRIARRGYPGTSQAMTWVSLEPGWEVMDGEDGKSTIIRHTEAAIH